MDKALIGATAAVLCVFIGQFFARLSERKQWKRDEKLKEFRELVTALSTAMTEQQHFIASPEPVSGELIKKDLESFKVAGRTIADRIFIRKDMKELKVGETYFDSREDFGNDNDSHTFGRRMDDLIDAIVEIAEKL
jgi:hypothetical protein